MRLLALLAFVFGCLNPVFSQTASQCEPTTEVKAELDRIQKLGAVERQAAYEELVRKLPEDIFVRLFDYPGWTSPGSAERNAAIEKFAVLAKAHPDGIADRYLYARLLVDTDTPQAIEILRNVTAADPGFPWAHVTLADAESWGKFADRRGTRQEIDAFYHACPANFDTQASGLLLQYGTAPMAAEYAPLFRDRLNREPDRPSGWKLLWSLEFKALPPGQHADLRKQIARDVEKLRARPERTSTEWLSLFRGGYDLAGDTASAMKMEAAMAASDPKSIELKLAASNRWVHEHPWPRPSDSEATKTSFYRALLQEAGRRLKLDPSDSLNLQYRFTALSELKDTSPEQIGAAADAVLAHLRKYKRSFVSEPFEFQIAQAYLRFKMRPEQIATLVDEGLKSYRYAARFQSSDRREDQDESSVQVTAADLLLDAATQLHQPGIAKAAVEALKEGPTSNHYNILRIRARFAEAEGRQLDALILYRAALDARSGPAPKTDELAANVDRLWKELGGTPAAREAWDKRSRPVAAVDVAGTWEKPKKEMPAWELSDLEGKTWKLTALAGKTVLVNVWATWCAPCQAEHPGLQKLYEKLKQRGDVQLLSFNVDDETGKVLPYMQEHKYTFPVLLAHQYIDEMLPTLSIPRNWVVDAHGKWTWEQIGFGNDEGWVEGALAKLGEKAN